MLPPDSIIEWLFDTFAWLFEEFGGIRTLEPAGLVMPTEEFFPLSPDLSGHQLALEVFSIVRGHGVFFNLGLDFYGILSQKWKSLGSST